MNGCEQKAMRRRPCALGVLLGAPYAGVMRLRRWAYHKGLLSRERASVPVVSVGNITCGGTGKTPMVAWVVRRLLEQGRRPAILTRGYKSVAGKSDEAELLKQLLNPLLAEASRPMPVIVNPDRVAGARTARSEGTDVLVMDDGFQHMRLRRNLDIVLIDASNPFGGGCCLPIGRLREPLRALRDAHAIVITRSDLVDADCLSDLQDRLGNLAPQASLHLAEHKPVRIIDEAGRDLPTDAIAGKKVFAFCGIGNPASFRATVLDLGADLAGFYALGDHAKYTPATIEKLLRLADEHAAEILLTTEKDFVKLADLPLRGLIWRLAVEMRITAGERELIETIESAAAQRLEVRG